MKFGNKSIGNKEIFIIAEAGINHNGSFETAKKLIDIAVESGADCVKFQKRVIEDVFTSVVLDRDYSKSKNSFGDTYRLHKENCELNEEQFMKLKEYSDEKGILFTASPWDKKSVDILERIDVPFYKIASADLNNLPLLKYIAEKNKPIIMSTGMADLDLVKYCFNFVHNINPNIILLQCTSTYPSNPKDINLEVITTYKKEFPNTIIGYSGHETGTDISLMAVACGAKVVERHFTLDKTMKGADHKASLEPNELKELVDKIRLFETVSGSSTKVILEDEKTIFKKLSKSIVYSSDLKENHVITENDICTKTSNDLGVSPLEYYNLIGKTLSKNVNKDDLLKMEDLS